MSEELENMEKRLKDLEEKMEVTERNYTKNTVRAVVDGDIYSKALEMIEKHYPDCWIEADGVKYDDMKGLPCRHMGKNRKIFVINPILKDKLKSYRTYIGILYGELLNEIVMSKMTEKNINAILVKYRCID